MATGTRTASSPTEDDGLELAIEQTRARVKALEQKLSSRRAAEQAELELLKRQLAELTRRATQATEALTASRAQHEALRAREQSLQRGLDLARRSWVRVFEPTLGAAAVFFCILLVGFAHHRPERLIALELAGVLMGTLIALAWRQWRGGR